MKQMPSTINIMIVDDHDLVRHGLKSLLSSQEGIEVVAEASSGEQAIDYCRNNAGTLDVIMMDINMPGIGGLEATQRIHASWKDIGIIIVSVHGGDGPLPKKLINGGARGYLSKGNKLEEMVTAIHDVHAGGCYIAKDIAQKLVLSELSGETTPLDSLSQRELQVLMMIAQGKKNHIISDSLNLSPKTISTYRKRLHEKLDVSSDIEMLLLAIKYDILDSVK